MNIDPVRYPPPTDWDSDLDAREAEWEIPPMPDTSRIPRGAIYMPEPILPYRRRRRELVGCAIGGVVMALLILVYMFL